SGTTRGSGRRGGAMAPAAPTPWGAARGPPGRPARRPPGRRPGPPPSLPRRCHGRRGRPFPRPAPRAPRAAAPSRRPPAVPSGAHPAGLRDVHQDAGRAGILHFDVAAVAAVAAHAHAQRLVDLVHRLRAGGSQPFGQLLHALHLEPDVVDAAVILAPLAGYLV